MVSSIFYTLIWGHDNNEVEDQGEANQYRNRGNEASVDEPERPEGNESPTTDSGNT